jgi:hypothetical protein
MTTVSNYTTFLTKLFDLIERQILGIVITQPKQIKFANTISMKNLVTILANTG